MRTGLRPACNRAAGRWEAVHLPGGAPKRRCQLSRHTPAGAQLQRSGRGAEEHCHATAGDHFTAEREHLQATGHHQRADHQVVAVRRGHRRQEVRQGRVVGEGETKHNGRRAQRSKRYHRKSGENHAGVEGPAGKLGGE